MRKRRLVMKKILSFAAIALACASGSTSIVRSDTTPLYLMEYGIKVEDDLAIRQVIARLNHALDAADYKVYGSFFAPNGVFVSGFGDAVGPAQVAAALEKVSPFITNKRHIAANLVISGRGDQAMATTYLIVFERQTELKYVGSAINVDTMKKVNGRWLVTKHESTLDPATAAYMKSVMTPKQ
jgi:ketosteroid isomerase-like protein